MIDRTKLKWRRNRHAYNNQISEPDPDHSGTLNEDKIDVYMNRGLE